MCLEPGGKAADTPCRATVLGVCREMDGERERAALQIAPAPNGDSAGSSGIEDRYRMSLRCIGALRGSTNR